MQERSLYPPQKRPCRHGQQHDSSRLSPKTAWLPWTAQVWVCSYNNEYHGSHDSHGCRLPAPYRDLRTAYAYSQLRPWCCGLQRGQREKPSAYPYRTDRLCPKTAYHALPWSQPFSGLNHGQRRGTPSAGYNDTLLNRRCFFRAENMVCLICSVEDRECLQSAWTTPHLYHWSP